MSLNPEDSRRRGRSKSPGRRDDDRDRSRSRVEEVREHSRVVIDKGPAPSSHYDDRDRDRYDYDYQETISKSSRRKDGRDEPRYSKYRDDSPEPRPKYAVPGGFQETEVDEDAGLRYGDYKEYEDRKYSKRDDYDSPSPPRKPRWAKDESSSPPRKPRYAKEESPSPPRKPRWAEEDSPSLPRKSRYAKQNSPSPPPKSRYAQPDAYRYAQPDPRDYRKDEHKERDSSFKISAGKHSISGGVKITHDERPSSPPYPSEYGSSNAVTSAGHSKYAEPKQWEYAQPQETISYTSRKETYSNSGPSYPTPHGSQSKIVTVEPGGRRTSGAASLGPRMSSLSVSGTSSAVSLSAAPGSPLLESYHGTYQSIGNMPSPLMIASAPHSSQSNIDVLDIGPSSPSSKGRHARFHDPSADAATLAKALKGSKSPNIEPLIAILPALTHEQILNLRTEYKKLVKTGSEKKGVNIAKHIKLRLKEEDPSFMKACYAVALGQWESEAYWANFWYQGEKSRRELLIESLMGRTNAEIRAIKDGFSDKKYSDSLTKCMKTELREDKFKKAVLLVLEERRMEERPGYALDRKLVEEDVRELYKAVRSEKGGETSMINIIVLRSDSHIREVLRVYEVSFRENFARAMLKKSGNLVGELLAHILNGIINRPVRDAMLLNHALSLTKSDSIRTELLISRLVRYHWDRPHMEAVKREYRTRYSKELQQAVHDGTKGDWGEFCEELCVRRMADDVKRVERVEMVSGYSSRR